MKFQPQVVINYFHKGKILCSCLFYIICDSSRKNKKKTKFLLSVSRNILELKFQHCLHQDKTFKNIFSYKNHKFIIFFKVSLLLENGAEINKKTSLGKSCLALATDSDADVTLMELLFKNGAQINERQWRGKTALHHACRALEIDTKKISFLIKNGADLNKLDNDGETPLQVSNNLTDDKIILIKQLAKMKFENQKICRENMEFLHLNRSLKKKLKSCLDELTLMKFYKVGDHLSVYDIFSSKRMKKMITLIKNEDFLSSFESLKNQFKYYNNELASALEMAKLKSEHLQSEQNKLSFILKDHLPELIIQKMAYFLCEEHIFS